MRNGMQYESMCGLFSVNHILAQLRKPVLSTREVLESEATALELFYECWGNYDIKVLRRQSVTSGKVIEAV